MFRVYDNKEQKWVKDDIYLNPNDELFMVKKSLLGSQTLNLLSQYQYIFHKDIGICDKNNNLVYEGDYIKAQVEENRAVIGLVAYATELSSYIILCVDSDEFYTLGSEVSSEIEIIGNVFDGYKKEKEDGKQAL